MIHSRVNKQYRVFGLIIAICDYGIDYYWQERTGYLFTSGKRYICTKTWTVAISGYRLRFKRL